MHEWMGNGENQSQRLFVLRLKQTLFVMDRTHKTVTSMVCLLLTTINVTIDDWTMVFVACGVSARQYKYEIFPRNMLRSWSISCGNLERHSQNLNHLGKPA